MVDSEKSKRKETIMSTFELIGRILVALLTDAIATVAMLTLIYLYYLVRDRGVALDTRAGKAFVIGVAIIGAAAASVMLVAVNMGADAVNRMYLIIAMPYILAGVWAWNRIAERFEADRLRD